MIVTKFHREDVKAILRKRYKSVEAFQRTHGLEGQQVRDLLRGKSSKALAVVARELNVEPDHLVITTEEVPLCGEINSQPKRSAHRLSEAPK